MSHWAELDENNVVLRVTVGDNGSSDDAACEWLVNNLGGRWVQTSYNGSIRKNFAGIGYTYDETRDAFIPPKPFPSWLLNEQTCQWEAPVAIPDDGKRYVWNEQDQQWDEAAQ